jgi:hypothetical protein
MGTDARQRDTEMNRRLAITCLAVFAALPSVALANNAELTYPTGTRLAAKTTFKGANVGSITFTSRTNQTLWDCTSGSLTGSIVKNNGSEVEADIESVSFSGTGAESKCTSLEKTGNKKLTFGVEQGLPWCLRATPAMKEDEFQIRGGKCSETSRLIRIGIDEVLGECKYKEEAPITGTFSTEPNDAVITATTPEFVREEPSPFSCTVGYNIDFSFTLERDEAGTHPAYFSVPPPNTPELTYPTGTRLATESKIRAHNVGELKITPSSGGTFACPTAEMTGTLTKNSGTETEANIEATNLEGTGSLSDCTSTLGSFNLTTNVTSGLPWCMRALASMKSDEFQLRGGKCAEASRAIKFTMDITGTAECTYERSTAVTGTFTTHPSEATLAISGAEFTKTAGPESCPTAPKLDWTFTLERDEEGLKPAYIS